MRRHLALALLVLAVPAPAFAGKYALNLEPSSVEIRGKPGTAGPREFKVKNNGKTPVIVELSISDMWHDGKNGRTFPKPGTSPRGAGAWLGDPPAQLEIAPNATVKFESLIHIPEGVAPGSYFAAILGLVKDPEVPESERVRSALIATTTMHVKFSINVVIGVEDDEGNVPNSTFTISNVEIQPPTAVRPLTIRTRVSNISVALGRVGGSVAVFDSAGVPVGKANFPVTKLWPTEVATLESTISAPLNPGAYKALVAVNSPENALAAPLLKEVPFAVGAAPAAPVPSGPSPRQEPSLEKADPKRDAAGAPPKKGTK